MTGAMVGYKRTDRVSDQIRGEIAEILMRRVKDPRVGFVTVTAVDVTADLKRAWVYCTMLPREAGPVPGDSPEAETMTALARASGFIRGELGRRLKLRYVPELTFVKDTAVDRTNRVMKLLEELHPSRESASGGEGGGEETHQ